MWGNFGLWFRYTRSLSFSYLFTIAHSHLRKSNLGATYYIGMYDECDDDEKQRKICKINAKCYTHIESHNWVRIEKKLHSHQLSWCTYRIHIFSYSLISSYLSHSPYITRIRKPMYSNFFSLQTRDYPQLETHWRRRLCYKICVEILTEDGGGAESSISM